MDEIPKPLRARVQCKANVVLHGLTGGETIEELRAMAKEYIAKQHFLLSDFRVNRIEEEGAREEETK